MFENFITINCPFLLPIIVYISIYNEVLRLLSGLFGVIVSIIYPLHRRAITIVVLVCGVRRYLTVLQRIRIESD